MKTGINAWNEEEGFLQSFSTSREPLWQPLLLGFSDTEPVTQWKCSCWMCSHSCKRSWWSCWLLTLRGSYRLWMLLSKASYKRWTGVKLRVSAYPKTRVLDQRLRFWVSAQSVRSLSPRACHTWGTGVPTVAPLQPGTYEEKYFPVL